MFDDPLIAIFFIYGLLFGSFANVVILRMPNGLSVVRPGSRCHSTGRPIPWYDNIPVISWLLLRGRSRFDGSRISIRYPFVELLTGVLFAACYIFFGWSASLIEALIFVYGLVIVSFIDFDHFILPDTFTLGGIVVGLVGSFLNPERSFVDALIGVLGGGGFLYLIAWGYEVLRKEEGMGGGDIKLLGWVGAILGWQSIPFVILGSSFFGLFGGLFFAIKSGKGMKTVLPFGPFIALAAVTFLFLYWPTAQGEAVPLPLFDFSPQ